MSNNICPLTLIRKDGEANNCEASSCAWWDYYGGRCAILSILREMERQHD